MDQPDWMIRLPDWMVSRVVGWCGQVLAGPLHDPFGLPVLFGFDEQDSFPKAKKLSIGPVVSHVICSHIEADSIWRSCELEAIRASGRLTKVMIGWETSDEVQALVAPPKGSEW